MVTNAGITIMIRASSYRFRDVILIVRCLCLFRAVGYAPRRAGEDAENARIRGRRPLSCGSGPRPHDQ
ncbi:hypothetical protein CHELA20_53257 [Hyphomicrobiales bacterium]|nr:hypothetical protein CHELA41_21666 [Hyphomicrobiales bacterium]CAH1683888.1 hypothetical protein CHELA20_53257 [Hyphomicrobiales bacterium]